MEWSYHDSGAFALLVQCNAEVRCVTDCTTGMAAFTAKQKNLSEERVRSRVCAIVKLCIFSVVV